MNEPIYQTVIRVLPALLLNSLVGLTLYAVAKAFIEGKFRGRSLSLRNQKLVIKLQKQFLVSFFGSTAIQLVLNDPLVFSGIHWIVWAITAGQAYLSVLVTWDAFLSDPSTGEQPEKTGGTS